MALVGKGAGELNLIILIPKTEARAQGGEVSQLFNIFEYLEYLGIEYISGNISKVNIL